MWYIYTNGADSARRSKQIQAESYEMPLKIALPKIAKALKVTDETARAKLKGVVFERKNDSAKEPRVFLLTAVLGRLFTGKKRPTEAQLAKLFERSTDDGELYTGDDHVSLALCDILATHLPPEAQRRYARVRSTFTAGLAQARGGASYMPYLDALQLRLLLNGQVLKFVVLGAVPDLDWCKFAPAFALCNARYEPLQVAA